MPVIVTVTGPPSVAPPDAVRVRVELPPALTEAGLKPAVTPDGRPLAARLMLSALPETRAVLIVLVPDAPWATETEVGLALMEKLFVTGAADPKAAMPFGVPRPVGPS